MFAQRKYSTTRSRRSRRIATAAELDNRHTAELIRFWAVFGATWCAAYGLGIWSVFALGHALARPLFIN